MSAYNYSSELFNGFGAMTPDLSHGEFTIPVEQMGSISRKLSKSSIGRSEDLSIPSPPLSPYQSSSTVTIAQALSNPDAIISSSPSPATPATEVSNSKVDTIVVLNKPNEEYPLDTFEKMPLVVNAWSDIGTKGFKKSQIAFLRSYINRSKYGKSMNKTNYSRRYAPRRVVRSYYNDAVSSSNFNNYNSDSDYNSQFEKVRTRRVARETSTHPTFTDSEVPSRVSTPVIKKRKPAPLSSPAAPVNIDWESIPDFSPSTATLPNNSRCLKVEWKGQPMSLADDPLVDKLHPAEVTLASILRLPCNLYLDSKRRLFAEKVTRLKRGLPFRRTDAQKSCRIDVNKASRLFAAFEKIGWLEDDKFDRFL